ICVFSFHPNKNITSIEGGALVMGDEREAREIEVLRFHGIAYLPDRTRDVGVAGGQFHLPDATAAVGGGGRKVQPAAARRRGGGAAPRPPPQFQQKAQRAAPPLLRTPAYRSGL